MNWIEALAENRRRGSTPRCLLLMEGERAAVAERLTSLIERPDVQVSEGDHWMPNGVPRLKPDGTWDKTPAKEAELGEAAGFLDASEREAVKTWWLATRRQASTPNWDIASTCTVEGRRGLLLVEAKAHTNELETAGKAEPWDAREGRLKNHEQIGAAIAEANRGLQSNTQLDWRLSRDSHYQLANRFAWAWKLTALGYPVVLLFLGFLNASEMRDRGEPFSADAAWKQIMSDHGQGLVPATAWETALSVNGQTLLPLMRTHEVLLTTG